jgi:hypothetical protein
LKRTSALAVGIVVAASLVVGGTSGSAARHQANVTPAKVTQLQRLSRLDGQFVSLAKRVKPCAGSAAQIKAAGTMRKAALKRARKSSVRVLKAKNVKMSKAVLRLAKFAGKCGVSGGSAPIVVQPGAPGSSSTLLTFPELMNSRQVDVASLLDGGILPDTISAVPLDELASGACVTEGTACLGIDANALTKSLTDAVHDAPLLGPITTPLLNQVIAALGADDLDSLLDVNRVSDTVIQLVPKGPLATLQALLDTVRSSATDAIGRLQLT